MPATSRPSLITLGWQTWSFLAAVLLLMLGAAAFLLIDWGW